MFETKDRIGDHQVSWRTGLVPLRSLDKSTVHIYTSALGMVKVKELEARDMRKKEMEDWLIGSHKDQLMSQSKLVNPIERIVFTPKGGADEAPTLDLDRRSRRDNGLLMPILCRGTTVFYARKGGGVFWVKSSRDRKTDNNWTVSLFQTRAPSQTFRFRTVVFLPSWTRKYFKDAIVEWYNDYHFIDAIFIIDCKSPLYWVFADEAFDQVRN